MKEVISAVEIASRTGYTVPLDKFGVVRWESSDGFAFVVASGDGDGGLGVQVGHKVDGEEEKIGTLTVSADGETQAAWLGEKEGAPALILKNILSALETMGNPVFIDSPEMV
jgi:hypothetical protein